MMNDGEDEVYEDIPREKGIGIPMFIMSLLLVICVSIGVTWIVISFQNAVAVSSLEHQIDKYETTIDKLGDDIDRINSLRNSDKDRMDKVVSIERENMNLKDRVKELEKEEKALKDQLYLTKLELEEMRIRADLYQKHPDWEK